MEAPLETPAAKFTSFVMFAAMRTGSNFLEASLNALPGVICYGEVFNPHFMGKKDNSSLFGFDLDMREHDPGAVLAAMRDQTPELAGFRLFHDHDPRVIMQVLADPACAKIILTRNPLESFVSLQIARATDQWRLTNAKNLRTARIAFDPADFETHLQETQAFQIELMHQLQISGQAAFYIDYEDLGDPGVLNGLAAFLGVAGRLDAPDPRLKKQNPEELADKVENPEAMAQSLARLDRFNLSRTPNFEPRRPAAVPGFVAAPVAPLLFMPVRGGPEAAIRRWLRQSGEGELITDFVQKTLRQWRRRNDGHRSFTVLRHPLARAHQGYCQVVLGGRNDLYRLMTKAYQLELPRGEDVGLSDHRAGFLAFLRWLKLYLGGQTGLRIDPALASQTAILQGLAPFQGPDFVFREHLLPGALAFLAQEVGLSDPPEYRPSAPALPFALQDICDDEIEAAARESYHRDYSGLGFGAWRDLPGP